MADLHSNGWKIVLPGPDAATGLLDLAQEQRTAVRWGVEQRTCRSRSKSQQCSNVPSEAARMRLVSVKSGTNMLVITGRFSRMA
jgi:hypothetical protein